MNIKKIILASLLAGIFLLPISAATFKTVQITPSASPDSVEQKAIEVFMRIASEKAGHNLVGIKGKALKIKLLRNQSLAPETFDIVQNASCIKVTASDSHGLLYGLGKILHHTTFDINGIIPDNVQGFEKPEKSVRGIYFATHFGNFYNAAPIDEVCRYVEELAMWGFNSLEVWFDMHHYTGINDPAAVRMISRLAAMLKAGRNMGMNSALTMLANEAYNTTPQELRAKRVPFTGFYGCEICPSKPGGVDLILKWRREMLDVFASLGVPFERICVWPYDQGGCTCEDCSPWGGNGYVKLTKTLAKEIRSKFPNAEIVLSTWCFDFNNEDKGEWRGLAKAFEEEKPWADYILADSHGAFPRYLMSNPVPGHLPLINFPEISMYMNHPWGGYGTNPMPAHYHQIYTEAAHLLKGGYPYSEGKYEDFNKVLYARMYWNSALSAEEITKEYIRSEFSAEYVDKICQAIFTIEKNFGQRSVYQKGTRIPDSINMPPTDFGAKETFETLKQIDVKLPPQIRSSWRWRLLMIRAELDYMLRQTNGQLTKESNHLFLELIQISHLENATNAIYPPYLAPYTKTIKSAFD